MRPQAFICFLQSYQRFLAHFHCLYGEAKLATQLVTQAVTHDETQLVLEMPSSLSDNVNGVRRPVSGNCEPTSHLLNFKPSGSAAAHVLVCESGMFVCRPMARRVIRGTSA